MNRATLVVITGLDGTGKSSLSKAVVDEFHSRGHDAFLAYGRYLPRLLYPIVLFGRNTIFSSSGIDDDYAQHQAAKEDFFDNDILAKTYEIAIILDYTPQFLHRVILPLYQHNIVVCDRYFYDTLLSDLAGDVIRTPSDAILRYDSYSKIIPRPDYEFYLRVPASISMERKDDIPSEGYLIERERYYEKFSEEYGFIELDGTLTLDQLTEQILSEIDLDTLH